MMRDTLYIKEVKITKEIPRNQYFGKLPVVQSLREKEGLQFNKKVTFSLLILK